MAAETIRTHVILPKDLVDEVDRVVGQRRRSEFVADALRAKLAHVRQGEALRAAAGMLNPADYPQWSTPEKTSAWVREQRDDDTKRLDELWSRYRDREGQ